MLNLPNTTDRDAASRSRNPLDQRVAYGGEVAREGWLYSLRDNLFGNRRRSHSFGAAIGFSIFVLLPTLIAAIYYGLIASNQYVAEFRFTVKEAQQRNNMPGTTLTSLLGGVSGTNNTDNYVVVDFLLSRHAIEQLKERIDVVKMYSRPGIDWWSRFDGSQPIERLIVYWQKMVTARYDQVTGIATAQVRAFSPQEALDIASTLVALSEELVNSIAQRTQIDAVRFAEKEVARAEDRLRAIRAKVTEFRNRTGVIDPTTGVAASNAALVLSLRASLAQMETQLSTLVRQNLEPNSPAIVVLNNQIKATRDQLQKVESVGSNNDGKALSAVVAEYEQLELERQFSQAMVTSTMQALDTARASAASQQLYITPFVKPHLPHSTTYPNRSLSVLTVAAVAFLIWMIGLLTVRSIRERFY
jgi:capsular polysaccharide transport system permease protein